MLEYIALGFLLFMAISLLFGAIAILDIPHKLAVERDHPHQEAIYYAGWVSLFTLHAAWPLVWVWAAAYRADPRPSFGRLNEETAANDKAVAEAAKPDKDITDSVTLLGHRYEVLDDRIKRIEKAILAAGEAA